MEKLKKHPTMQKKLLCFILAIIVMKKFFIKFGHQYYICYNILYMLLIIKKQIALAIYQAKPFKNF